MSAKSSEQGQSRPDGRFKKGQSGNPGGRPVVAHVFRERARKAVDDEAFSILLAMMRSSLPESEDRRYALTKLIEYAYGKPQQHMDVTSGGQPLVKAYVGVDVDKACP